MLYCQEFEKKNVKKQAIGLVHHTGSCCYNSPY